MLSVLVEVISPSDLFIYSYLSLSLLRSSEGHHHPEGRLRQAGRWRAEEAGAHLNTARPHSQPGTGRRETPTGFSNFRTH